MRLTTRNGSALPLWFEDINSTSVATAAFNPFAVYAASSKTKADESVLQGYIHNGFGVQNATSSGVDIYGVTWSQYQEFLAANKADPYNTTNIAALVPRHIYLAPYEWCLTPMVTVRAANDATYTPTAGASTVNIGIIL